MRRTRGLRCRLSRLALMRVSVTLLVAALKGFLRPPLDREEPIPDDSQLRPAVSHRMLVVLTADQRGAAVLIAGKPT